MIRLSKKWEYALRAVMFLAQAGKDNYYTVFKLSEELNISESFLRRIISEVEKTKIIKSQKGRRGWISISKEPGQYSVYEILKAVEEEIRVIDFDANKKSPLLPAYKELQEGFEEVLKKYTFDKLFK